MKKFIVALLALAAVSFAAAQDFTVRGEFSFTGDVAAVVEYAHPVGFGEFVLGASVTPALDVEALFGVRAPLATVDQVVFSVPVLVHLPVFDGQDFILGQLAGSVGLEAHVTQANGFGLVFSGAARSDLNDSLLTLPDFSVGVGLRYDF